MCKVSELVVVVWSGSVDGVFGVSGNSSVVVVVVVVVLVCVCV